MTNNVDTSRFISIPGRIPPLIAPRAETSQNVEVQEASLVAPKLPPEIIDIIFEWLPKTPAVLFRFMSVNHEFFYRVREILLNNTEAQQAWFQKGFEEESRHVPFEIYGSFKDAKYHLAKLTDISKRKDIEDLYINMQGVTSGNEVGKYVASISSKLLKTLSENKNLKNIELYLDNNNFSGKHILKILENTGGIFKKIDLSDSQFSIDEFNKIILSAIEREVEYINFYRNREFKITYANLEKLLKSVPCIELISIKLPQDENGKPSKLEATYRRGNGKIISIVTEASTSKVA